MTRENEPQAGSVLIGTVRRFIATVSWLACTFFAAHNALRQNWEAAIFFLLFPVLIELAEANGRLAAIQKNSKPTRIDIA